MARIVLGIGCSHTPQLHTPAEQWDIRARRDMDDGVPLWFEGEKVDYATLAERRASLDLGESLGEDVRQEKLDAAHAALERLRGVVTDAQPDVVVIFGNDQDELFLDDLKPAFTVMGAATFENLPRTDEQIARLPPGIALSDVGHLPESGSVTWSGHPALAEHIARHVCQQGFDAAYSARQVRADPARAQTSGLPHAYGFVCKQLLAAGAPAILPIDTNTFFPPNQPSAERCFAFGKAVGDAIRNWKDTLRIAVIASGGLSHFVVDESFDRDIMAAMARNDFAHLLKYREGYYQAGSSEIKSWIAAGGAMAAESLRGEIVDYQPLYRTPAGTGSSAAFMTWR